MVGCDAQVYIYIQVYNTFIPNNIYIYTKAEKSMWFGGAQPLRFAQSIDIDGGKRTLYLYSYEKSYIFCDRFHFPTILTVDCDDEVYIYLCVFSCFCIILHC